MKNIFILLICFFSLKCWSDSNTEKLLEMMEAKETYESLLATVLYVAPFNEFPEEETYHDSDLYHLVSTRNDKEIELRETYISWEAAKPHFVQAYEEVFTSEEIDAYISFLNTPLGQKIINEEMTDLWAPHIQQMVTKYHEKSSELNDQFMDELRTMQEESEEY